MLPDMEILQLTVSYNLTLINQLSLQFEKKVASKNEGNLSKYYNALAFEWMLKCTTYMLLIDQITTEDGVESYLKSSPEILFNSFTLLYLIYKNKFIGDTKMMTYISDEYQNYLSLIEKHLNNTSKLPEYKSYLSTLKDFVNECGSIEPSQGSKNAKKQIKKSANSDHLNEYYDSAKKSNQGSHLQYDNSMDDRDALYGSSKDTTSRRDSSSAISVSTKSTPITKDREHQLYSTIDELKSYMKFKYLFSDNIIVIPISYQGKYTLPQTTPRGTHIVNIDPSVLNDVHHFAQLANEYPFLQNIAKFENIVFFNPDDTNPNHVEDCSNSLKKFSKLVRSIASDMGLTIKIIELQKSGERVLFMKRHRKVPGQHEDGKFTDLPISQDQKLINHRRGSSVSPVRSSNALLNTSSPSLTNDHPAVSMGKSTTRELPVHSYTYSTTTLDPSKKVSNTRELYTRPALPLPQHSGSTDTLLQTKMNEKTRPPIPNAPNLISSTIKEPSRAPQSTLPHPPSSQVRIISKNTNQFDPTNTAFGLQNYQNTCYINSMIQCLFNISSFRSFFVKDGFYNLLRRKYGESNLSLCVEISNLFKQCVISNKRVIKPEGFLRLCAKLRPDLNIPIEQQDTSQFFYFLTDRLHEELRLLPTAENIERFSVGDPSSDLFASFSSNSEYLKWHTKTLEDEGASPISKWFQIEMETSLRCHRCGFESMKYEHSSMLTLNFMSMSRMSINKPIHLGQMISTSLANEELSESKGNAWNCPKCEKYKKLIDKFNESARELQLKTDITTYLDSPAKSQRKMKFGLFKRGQERNHEGKSDQSSNSYSLDAVHDTEMKRMHEDAETAKYILSQPNISTKTTRFVALPRILVIYLARTDINQNKITTPVISPKSLVLDVDLEKNGTPETGLMHPKTKYQLTGWISHIGSNIEHGHYTAYIQKNRHWIHCDDEYVSAAEFIDYSETDVSDSNSYILFYIAI